MKVDFALLADEAESSEGKVDIRGGGISHITATELPTSVARLALVARFILEEADRGKEHEFQFRLMSGEATIIESPTMGLPADAAPAVSSRSTVERAALVIVLRLDSLSFPDYGTYLAELAVDGELAVQKEIAVIPDDESARTVKSGRFTP